MNKKITITTGLLAVAFMGLAAATSQKITSTQATGVTYAYIDETLKGDQYDDYINAETVNNYEVDDGVNVLTYVERYTNDSKGRCVEKIAEAFDDESGKYITAHKETFEWNNNDLLTKNCSYKYNEQTGSFEINSEDEYEFTDNGDVSQYYSYTYEDGGKTLYRKKVNTFESGLVKEMTLYGNVSLEFQEMTSYEFEYDDQGRVSKVKRNGWTNGEVRKKYTNIVNEYKYDQNGDITNETNYNYNTEGVCYSSYTIANTYLEPHKLNEAIRTIYSDEEHTNITRVEKYACTYNGDEVTEIISFSSDGTNFEDHEKNITVRTDELDLTIRYYWQDGKWDLSFGEKSENIYSNGKLTTVNSSIMDEQGNWELTNFYEIVYQTKSSFPVGAVIGIVCGSLVVIYAVFYVLWKKQTLAFLNKPVFGKAFGWIDNIVKKFKK